MTDRQTTVLLYRYNYIYIYIYIYSVERYDDTVTIPTIKHGKPFEKLNTVIIVCLIRDGTC